MHTSIGSICWPDDALAYWKSTETKICAQEYAFVTTVPPLLFDCFKMLTEFLQYVNVLLHGFFETNPVLPIHMDIIETWNSFTFEEIGVHKGNEMLTQPLDCFPYRHWPQQNNSVSLIQSIHKNMNNRQQWDILHFLSDHHIKQFILANVLGRNGDSRQKWWSNQ